MIRDYEIQSKCAGEKGWSWFSFMRCEKHVGMGMVGLLQRSFPWLKFRMRVAKRAKK